MRALLAFDKFKDALSAREACAAAASALHRLHPDWALDLCPLTDGGEGFVQALTESVEGRYFSQSVAGPLNRSVVANIGLAHSSRLTPNARARLGLNNSQTLALMGLAEASGLELVKATERNPWHTTTLGTGELVNLARGQKADAILLGVGGSATNDLGLGALVALGGKFLDDHDQAIPVPTPATWERIKRIDTSGLVALPPLFIACDVTNPLLGATGATATFGPQKGLKPADLPRLEVQAARIAALLCASCGQPFSLTATPGAGAAGGIAFGLMVAAGAKIIAGFDLVSDWLDLPTRLVAADLVITGEGRFDATSLAGKGPGSLVREAQRLGKPVHVFAGSIDLTGQVPHPAAGFHPHVITPVDLPLTEALPRTAELLGDAINRAL